jgi:antitoxin CcdA
MKASASPKPRPNLAHPVIPAVGRQDVMATGAKAAVGDPRQESWLAESIDALESSNAFVERNGVPLSQFRMF